VLGADDETAEGHTGIYVRPGDADELRRAIAYLLAHPDVARMLGANGRRFVESTMSLDQFTDRMVALIEGHAAASGEPAAHRVSPAS
jgi:glycosyltransferase involved in cell wall biosynthesis